MSRRSSHTGRRPRIGVTTSAGCRGARLWPLHALALWRAGARPHRLTPTVSPSRVDRLDGLVIGGGDDIAAGVYGGDVRLDVRIDPARDRFELAALERAAVRGLPVLGICRGAQLLNISRGGTLHQDIHRAFADAPRHRTVLPRKQVTLATRGRLRRLLRRSSIRVNSLHHQAVDRLGTGLHVAARDRAGIVQAIEARGPRFLLGVQWHPELLFYQGRQVGLYHALTRAAARGRRRAAGAA
ncbi:type 1 glutamine amidotransferase [Roseospira marina]|uniref:Type 1 glutamine amidotransferase n=1 Tax=Roseospira marina TaxID=140057 RepID=A0A5M6IBY8_9PROT|nr:type 1 glutamine amidotransferase [Roseospira marina]KAA5605259.1 type 1 glutamine amidotransferase [Roseospira marina]MBB4314719.1 putative glutamine amidotransferase [Roseospira marina]MBB5087708.1 putative glutamine amidotransferase [Roseospira marina]